MNIRRYAPQLLTAVGVAGMIGTVITAVKSTSKAEQLLDEAEQRLRELSKDNTATLDKKETVKCFVKAYWVPATMGAISIACFIGSNYVFGKRAEVMATALGATQAALSRFQASTLETLGEDAVDKIRSHIADKELKANPMTKKNVIGKYTEPTENENKGSENDSAPKFDSTIKPWCFDSYTGKYFRCDMQTIKEAINTLNRDMQNGDFVSVADLYDAMGISANDVGSLYDNLGWHSYDGGEAIDIKFSARILDNFGNTCMVIIYNCEPTYFDGSFYSRY